MTTARPRLLFVSPLPPPRGGISNWMVAVRESALRERFEIRVVNSSPSAEQIVAISRLRGRRILDAIRILARVVFELVRFRPDVVHVNTSYFWAFLRDGLTIRLARLCGARTVLHVHGGDFVEWAEGSNALVDSFVRATLRKADLVIAITKPTQEWLEKEIGAERVRYLPNFVRLDAVGTAPDRSGREGRPVEVLFVGWLLEAKGVRELLAAARELPDVRFTLVGHQEPHFTAEIRDELLAFGDRLRALPARSHEEVFQLYREADVFVLPTWREGFPNVVIEAMAAGLPVVSTPVGAIPEAIEDGISGLLVPARDAVALARALRRLCDDPALRRQLGARARARVEAVFAYEIVVAQLEAFYCDLIG